MMEASEIKEIAKKCVVFETLNDDEFDLLLFYGELKDLASGATIYETGETAEGTFCLILSGTVEVVTQTGHRIRKMGPCEVIGEIGATSPQNKRTVTVRTLEPISVLEWEVKQIGARWPALLKKLKDQAWKRLAQYYESEKK
jgi:CRP-like cAMP-binding protein